MAAFNYTQPSDATGEVSTYNTFKRSADVYPNFNGQAGIPYNGNYVITGSIEIPQGMLWTAHYAVVAPNTITIQFTSPLISASTTTSDYTLSGTGAPSISSVSFTAGSRNVQLNLSGSLSAVNTYTLAIGANKILSGNQISYANPKTSVYNWPNLVVDVIQPATIACTGVGIDQIVDIGAPNLNTAGDAVATGIQQDVDVGSPDVDTLIEAIGDGIQQDVDVGSPDASPDAVNTGVGVVQPIALGTPSIVQEQEPVGVGINQTIDLGSPITDINPISIVGIGINEVVGLGNPRAAGPVSTIGGNILVTADVGQLPRAWKDNTQEPAGVGINQTIDLGSPDLYFSSTFNPDSWDQIIDVGNPLAILSQFVDGVGIDQLIDTGIPNAAQQQFPIGVGIDQPIDIGVPMLGVATGVGIQQDIAVGVPGAWHPLRVTHRQHLALIDIDTALQKAFGDGVQGDMNLNLIAPIQDYLNIFNSLQQQQTKLIFEDLAAATLIALNIPGILPITQNSGSTNIAKLTSSGSTGSLAWVDGFLVSKTNPT